MPQALSPLRYVLRNSFESFDWRHLIKALCSLII